MASRRIDFKCPHCNKKGRIKIHDEYTSQDIDSLLKRECFKTTCSSCNETTIVDYPFIFKGDNYIIYYNTVDDETSANIKRICTTYEDFKEKLLILSSNLNDIIIEYMRVFLYTEIRNQKLEEPDEIRFDSCDDESIKFYLIGQSKYATLPMEFYNNLIESGKLTEPKEAVLIDSNTLNKYFHL